jgi:hypothetical protein
MKPTMRLITACLVMLSITEIHAQKETVLYPRKYKFSAAILAGEYGYDMSIGAELGSSPLLNDRLCVRLRGNINWLEQYKNADGHLSKYKSVGAYIVYNFLSADRSRINLEAGTFFILPNKNLSVPASVQGFSGSTAVELFIVNSSYLNLCYYFSGGVSYTKTSAEKLETKSKLGNGFVFNNGFRFYF